MIDLLINVMLGFSVAAFVFVVWLITHEFRKKTDSSYRLKREHKRRAKLSNELQSIRSLLKKYDDGIADFEVMMAKIPENMTVEVFLKHFKQSYSAEVFCNNHFLRDDWWFKSPLIVWMDEWLYDFDGRTQKYLSWKAAGHRVELHRSKPGHNSQELLREAIKLQQEGWRLDLEKLVSKRRKLRLEANKLCQALGLEIEYEEDQAAAIAIPPIPEPPKTRSEIAREELKFARVRVAELEEEVLSEEQKDQSPMRRAAGVHTDKD